MAAFSRFIWVPRASEIDVAAPRYRDNPNVLVELLLTTKNSGENPLETFERKGRERRNAFESLLKKLAGAFFLGFYQRSSESGDPIEARPGFSALLDRLESNGVRTVVVEDASRFARDLVAQELGLLLLIKRDVRVLTANGDDLTDTTDPSRVMMRQIAGSFAQFEKTRLVTKLRGARERIRETKGKCEGRKSYAERDPELVLAAKRLHRRSPKGHRRSLRDIARELQAMGYSNKQGQPYSASCIKSMVESPTPSANAQ